jgi:succinate-acetate transporter protein
MSEEKIADPGPLGLAAFAMTTFCLSSANAGLWKGAGVAAALSLALMYGGITQLLAGMWEFVRKNTFGALAFSSYGAFWLGLYALVNFQKAFGDNGSTGIFLLGWTIFTAYMLLASKAVNKVVFTVFLLLTITFVLLTIGNWGMVGAHAGLVKAGGWTGLATALVAWYASAAGVVNATHGKTVLPVA